jgi:hypothetical protein
MADELETEATPVEEAAPVEAKAEARIVEGVFASANAGRIGPNGGKSPLAKIIEQGMSDAIAAAYAEGVTDPEEIRARMMSAREEVKTVYAAAVEETVKRQQEEAEAAAAMTAKDAGNPAG